MAGIIAAKILINRRNVKDRSEKALSELLKLLDNERSGRVKLEHFMDILEEHGIEIPLEEQLELFDLANEHGYVGHRTLIIFLKNCSSWAEMERLDGEKTKMELILARSKRVYCAFSSLDQNKDGLVGKADFKAKFGNLTEHKIDLIFRRYNKTGDQSLDFVDFKNFMNRRPPHKDLMSRRSSVLSLLSSSSSCLLASNLSLASQDSLGLGAWPPRYSSLSQPPRYSSLAEQEPEDGSKD